MTAATVSEDRSQSVVLVVDDEPSICWGFQRMLSDEGHQVLTASSAEEGLELAERHRPEMILLDVRLPGQDGITSLPRFRELTGEAPVIVMTAFGDLETAVEAVRQGASDYLTKPFRLEDAARVCRDALRTSSSMRSRPQTPRRNTTVAETLIGGSAAMQQVFRQIALVAKSDLSVLITGETGTGKELVAAAIHRHSHRSEKPYVPIAPIALNPALIESELFGHVKGAFTGATDDRRGLFEIADGGTILLDEIGDLPASTQVKLLRVLEQGRYSRVGDPTPRSCSVRILAATNCDLHAAVQEGRFREDLMYRLSAAQVHLPPLRRRCDDLPMLCRHFLEGVNYPDPDGAIDEGLIEQLQERPWYGNVRELRNAVERAAVVARGRPLGLADFPPPQLGRSTGSAEAAGTLRSAVETWTRQQLGHLEPQSGGLHERYLAASEPALLRVVLEHTRGNRAAAAELLGIHRGTLRERLRTYKLDDA